jgi:DNA-binding GntR family transcriptional regulator
MSGSGLKRTCMRDHIRTVLVARILDGTYPAGTQLKELSLAREFNVSQAPIREALRELEGSGLITCERYRGSRVRGADFNEMRESYELRTMIEVRCVQLVLPCAPALLESLAVHLREMATAVTADDREHYIDEALSFHRELVAASGNRTFLSVWDSLHWDVRGRIALRNIAERGRGLKPLIGLHRKLLAALRAQDCEEAMQALRAVFAYVGTAFSPQKPSKKDFTAERQKGGTSPA